MRDEDEAIGDIEDEQSPTKAVDPQNARPDDDEGMVVQDDLSSVRSNNYEPDSDMSHVPAVEIPVDRGNKLAGDASSSEIELESIHEEENDYAPRSEVENRLAEHNPDNIAGQLKATVLADAGGVSDADSGSVPRLGKAKQKRAKKLAQRDAGVADPSGPDFKCVVCHGDFPSKTKLFSHIKEKGHAAPVAAVASKRSKGKRI